MTYEVIVEAFVLQVEVTSCENTPPNPDCCYSDWDFYGSHELEFTLVSGITYDADGIRMDASASELAEAGEQYASQIEAELWRQIETNLQRKRWAA